MNSKQEKTLKAIFSSPVNGNIEWKKVESLLKAIGCEVIEGKGSLVKFSLNNEELPIHRPHPNKDSLRYRIVLVRQFLTNAGFTL